MEISLVHPPGAKKMPQPIFFGEKPGYESITRFVFGKKRVMFGDDNPFFSAKKHGLLTHF